MAEINDILKKYWGYESFRSLQEDIIRSVLSGRDTLALMPTGGGKSITYQVSALSREGICVVITPLIALMKDQVEDLKKRNLSAEAVYTGMPVVQIESAINKCIYNGVKFLYISPERLASENFRMKLKQMKVCLLAVDEAHCISQWGYDFRPSYLRIAEIRTFFPDAPLLALTATATPDVIEDIQRQLQFKTSHVLSKSFRRENISYIVRNVEDKLGELVHILSRISACAIVYVRKRNTAEQLSGFLNEKGIIADFYHAGLTSGQREEKQGNWKTDRIPVIVATNAFGMGIDKSDVRVVVHYDIPDSPEAYFQEAGRAGRDGQKAYAVLLSNKGAVTALKARIAKGFPEKSYIKQVYEALGNFFQIAEGSGCGYTFEFDADTFVKNFKLDYPRMLSAIKILEVGGYLECTTEVNSKSRLCFLVSRDLLDQVVPENELQEKLLVALMRKYAGIFAQYIFIREQYLADELGVTRQQVYDALITLAKRRILSYIPGNDRPYIVYHQPRLPLSYLTIGKNAYEDRKQVYVNKVNAMVRYIEEDIECRQLVLMRYFGQKEKQACGICDHCLEKKNKSRLPDYKQLEHAILNLLSQKDIPLKEISGLLDIDSVILTDCLRSLLDNGRIYYSHPMILSLVK